MTKLGDINQGETITMAPLVVKGKVLIGNSGGEMGVHGWVTALNEEDGKIAWRAYGTGPDSDVLIGPDFKPLLRLAEGQGSGRQDLAGRRLEAWRRHACGAGSPTIPR